MNGYTGCTSESLPWYLMFLLGLKDIHDRGQRCMNVARGHRCYYTGFIDGMILVPSLGTQYRTWLA